MYLVMTTLMIFLLALALKFYCERDSLGEVIGFIGIFIMGLLLIAFTFTIICNHAFVDAKIAENNAKYESLCYRLEITQSNFEDFSKTDVMEDVLEWNIDVARYKKLYTNKWVSCFYSKEMVEALQFVDLHNEKTEVEE